MNNSIFLDKNKLNDKSERSKLSLFFFGYKPTTQEKKLHRIKFLSMYNSGEKYEELLGIPNLYDRVKNKVKVFLSSSKYFLRNNKVKVFLLGYRPTKQEEGVNKYNHLVNYLSQSETPYVSLEKPSILIRMKNSLIDGYNKVEAKFKKLFTKNKHTFSESNESKVDRTKLIDELMNASKKDKEND